MPEDGRLYITRKKTLLNREQKTGFGMVVAFGALALVFGTFYLWKHVASPFVVSYTGPEFLTGDEERQREMERLRKEDTDKDGLNDYDELYIYRTSPYIADSDSDGVDDKTEVMNGGDPNCALNMPCGAVEDTVNPVTVKGTFVEAVADAAGATVAAGAPETITPSSEDIGALLAQMSAAELKALLIEAGGDADAVNALTDEELRQALSQALQVAEIQEATDPSVAPSEPNTP